MKTNKFLLLLASISFFNLSCSNEQQTAIEEPAEIASKPEDAVKHGLYLVTIMGCNDCHSPKQMGPNGPEIIPELLLSGYPAERPVVKFTDPMIKAGFAMLYPDLTAAAGPWGVSFAANLTPDETGLGNWTEAQFKKAITEGKFKGLDSERMLLPTMPWFNYTSLTDEDVSSIFAYLKSIKPVKNSVPAPITPDNM
ncbi:c-type cytochrome [Arcticibacterium luteifluviistationis]|uniref:Diheme cytochrome c-553 n=1 Tax=Arcticibacterium luteifluviistationis TaxID=1784714 RepID=A0A2Z4GHJ4_9BACT|nr:diheme cytochrome c-553 [Arcticibacterium luteifluviistationis]AWW00274.1 diheme cytochrome c-553 [Arcticibacterium luteifluviistationis]